MWHLIKKDILLCRMGISIIITISFFLGYFSLMFMSILATDSLYSIFMLGYFLAMGLSITVAMIMDREKKVDGNMILHSIPLDKELIITSRYISAILFPTVHGLVILIYSYFLKFIHGFMFTGFRISGEIEPISIFNLMAVLALIITFLSVYLFLYYYKFGDGKFLNIAIYFTVIIFPALIAKFWDNIKGYRIIKSLSYLNKESTIIIVFISSIVLYIISMEATKRIAKQ